jgi:hypothetical protein
VLGAAIAQFSTLAHVLMIVMPLLLPETLGRAIASLEPEAAGAPAPRSRSAVAYHLRPMQALRLSALSHCRHVYECGPSLASIIATARPTDPTVSH